MGLVGHGGVAKMDKKRSAIKMDVSWIYLILSVVEV